jgi:maleylpyruvate isomerase
VTPEASIELLRVSTRRLLRTIDGLTDEQAHDPSRLPGWNRAEVLTHVARNADGTRRMVHAAEKGAVEAQYPGGLEERAVDIAAGRDAPADEVVRDVRRSHDAMMEAWRALPDDAWARVGRAISGERTMREALWARVREVEVHHVDLAMGYEATDWPVAFVTGALDEIFSSFKKRASNVRPLVDADFRVVSTDHERAWRIALHGPDVDVQPDGGTAADGEARGWGCDLVSWLYGRDPEGGGIMTSGDTAVLRLPRWFPYA